MSHLCISTRGISSWRERLAAPDHQWKRRYSAFETAVSWELASKSKSGIPAPVGKLFRDSDYDDPVLIFAVAEHKVELPGGNAASQSDVWGVVKTIQGMLSLTVEAKANEAFGDDVVAKWLAAGKTVESKKNRESRLDYILSNLPPSEFFLQVRYQIVHRCAASVIEAKRFGFQHAAFVVQSFNSPEESFQDYAVFCHALKDSSRSGKNGDNVRGWDFFERWLGRLPTCD